MKNLSSNILTGLTVFGILLMVTACEEVDQTAERKDSQTVANQQRQYQLAQPVPVFDFSLERDVYIQLYQARNRNVATHTIWRSDFGKVLGDCSSIGYPIPYDSSLTNPLKVSNSAHNYGYAITEQAEPNGLFASKNSIATWIRCVVEVNGVVSQVPVYVEDKVTAYPYPVEVDYDTDRVRIAGAPSVTLDAK